LETVKQKINSLNKDINTVKNKVNTYKDLLNLLENQALRNEFIIDFYSKRLAEATAELNALRNEQQSLTNDFNKFL
jgi:peptidoglycan hydrolase CwlO-like protein